MSEILKVPRGRILVKVFTDTLPVCEMSGDIKPSDINYLLLSVRKAFADHLSAVGAANKKRVAEKLAREAAEENKQTKSEVSTND